MYSPENFALSLFSVSIKCPRAPEHIIPTYGCRTSRSLDTPHLRHGEVQKKHLPPTILATIFRSGHSSALRGWQGLPISLYFSSSRSRAFSRTSSCLIRYSGGSRLGQTESCRSEQQDPPRLCLCSLIPRESAFRGPHQPQSGETG